MNRGMLADYFTGVAWKSLSQVETDPATSNQHEFNGVAELRRLLGTPAARTQFPAQMIYLSSSDDDPIIEPSMLTWYDSRENHPTRTEWRLYFPSTIVTDCAAEGDILVIARRPDDTLLVIVAEGGSTIANQILWLFGIGDDVQPGFSIREELETEQDRLGFASRLILESIGVEVHVVEESALDHMMARFGHKLPATRIFSGFARQSAGVFDIQSDPDGALMAWMTKEEILFRTFEKHLVAERLQQGFEEDVDGFIAFSLSVQNRRKSRMGWALENHTAALFDAFDITYARSPITENKSKPDFLFPGSLAYHNSEFDTKRLTVLGAKSTCKDRWRQVLSEAKRVKRKHLLTLEAAISVNQTNEMEASNLQLVLPQSLHTTYTESQRAWLLNVSELISILRKRQGDDHRARRHPERAQPTPYRR